MSQNEDGTNLPSLTPTVYDAVTVERMIENKMADADHITAKTLTVTEEATINELVLNGWTVTVVE